MATQNDGGQAFPVPGYNGPHIRPNGQWDQDWSPSIPGMSLRAWLVSQETLSDFDQPDSMPSSELCENLAGPMPEGGWRAGNILAMTVWEAKWRAALKLMRADAVLAALNNQPK